MERLTDNTDYCTSWSDCEMPEGKCVFLENCYDRQIYNKLREYEDLEEQLEKVYGEWDGLLETAVKSLVKYNGEKPNEARLLTDEDTDRWEEYKRLEEQGLLLRLPCRVGDTLYIIGSECLANTYPDEFCEKTDCDECIHEKKMIVFTRTAVNHLLYTVIVGDNDNLKLGKTVFLTREEAEAALKEMEK